MTQVHYRRRSEPAAAPPAAESIVARVLRASLLLLGLALVVASCVELAALVRHGWGLAQPLDATLGAATASVDVAQLLPSMLLPLAAIASFVASGILRGREASLATRAQG